MISNFKCQIPLSTTHFRDVTQWISAYYHSVQLPCVKTLQKFSKLIINNIPHPPTYLTDKCTSNMLYIFFNFPQPPPACNTSSNDTHRDTMCNYYTMRYTFIAGTRVCDLFGVILTNISGFDFTYSTVQNVSYSI